MASTDSKEASCLNDPNFAIICAFLQKFAVKLNVDHPNFNDLQKMIENTDEVSEELKNLIIKLLRKNRKTVYMDKWEHALAKFCYGYSTQDAWEIERFGFKKASLTVKLRVLKEIMECQFERNLKFKSDINLISADELRTQPIGKDKLGNAYWSTLDDDLNLRIYQEHLDEDIWKIVANNRDELSTLIDCLKGNDMKMPSLVGIADEDSSSNSMPPKIDALHNKTDYKSAEESSSTGEPRVQKAQQDEAKEVDVKIKEKTTNGAAVELKQQKPKAQASTKVTKVEEDDDDDDSEEEDEVEEEEDEDDSDDEDDESNISEIDENSQAQSESSSGTINKKVKVDDELAKRPSLMASKPPSNKPLSTIAKVQPKSNKRTIETGGAEEIPQKITKTQRPILLNTKQPSKTNKFANLEDEGDDEDDDGDEEEEEEEEEEEDEEDAEEDEDETDDEVGEEIEEPVMYVKGEGSGKENRGSNFLENFVVENSDEDIGEEIIEETMYVVGCGSGADCLIGNPEKETTDVETPTSNKKQPMFFFGQPGCLKLSPIKSSSSTPTDKTNPKFSMDIFESLTQQPKADSADSSTQGNSSSDCSATEDNRHIIHTSSKLQSEINTTAQCEESNKHNPNVGSKPVEQENDVKKSTVLTKISVSVLSTNNDGLSEKSEMGQENVIEVPNSKLSDEQTLSSTSYNITAVPLNSAEPQLSEAISNNGKKRKITEEKPIDSLKEEHIDEQTVAHNLNNKRTKVKTQSNEQKRNVNEAGWSSDSEDDVLTKKLKIKQNENTTEVKETVLISDAMEKSANAFSKLVLPPQVFENQKNVHETNKREHLPSTSEKVFENQKPPATEKIVDTNISPHNKNTENIVKEIKCSVSTTERSSSNKEPTHIRIMEVNQESFLSKEADKVSSEGINRSFKDEAINPNEESIQDLHLQLKELKAAAAKSSPESIQGKQHKEKPISSTKIQSNITRAKQLKDLHSEVSLDVTSTKEESDNDSVKIGHALKKEPEPKPKPTSKVLETERGATTYNNEDKVLKESKNISESKDFVTSISSNSCPPHALETSLLSTNRIENVLKESLKIVKSISFNSSLPEEISTSKLPKQTEVMKYKFPNVEPSTSKEESKDENVLSSTTRQEDKVLGTVTEKNFTKEKLHDVLEKEETIKLNEQKATPKLIKEKKIESAEETKKEEVRQFEVKEEKRIREEEQNKKEAAKKEEEKRKKEEEERRVKEEQERRNREELARRIKEEQENRKIEEERRKKQEEEKTKEDKRKKQEDEMRAVKLKELEEKRTKEEKRVMEGERLKKLQNENEEKRLKEEERLKKLQAEMEEKRIKEEERQTKLEAEKEEKRIKEEERLKKIQAEKEEKRLREQEKLKKLQAEMEEKRIMEEERQKKLETEKEEKRLKEEQRQKKMEAEKEEKQRQKKMEAEKEEKRIIEEQRQKKLEAEKEEKRIIEEQRQKKFEAEKEEKQRQKKLEAETEEKRIIEEQRQTKLEAEMEEKRIIEKQRQKKLEAEKEEKRIKEEERLKKIQAEKEEKRLREQEKLKKLQAEKEEKRIIEEERQKKLEAEKEEKRLKEEQKQKKLEAEKRQTKLQAEKEEKRIKEEEKKEKLEAEKEAKRIMEEDRKKQLEAEKEKKKKIEAEREEKRLREVEKQKLILAEQEETRIRDEEKKKKLEAEIKEEEQRRKESEQLRLKDELERKKKEVERIKEEKRIKEEEEKNRKAEKLKEKKLREEEEKKRKEAEKFKEKEEKRIREEEERKKKEADKLKEKEEKRRKDEEEKKIKEAEKKKEKEEKLKEKEEKRMKDEEEKKKKEAEKLTEKEEKRIKDEEAKKKKEAEKLKEKNLKDEEEKKKKESEKFKEKQIKDEDEKKKKQAAEKTKEKDKQSKETEQKQTKEEDQLKSEDVKVKGKRKKRSLMGLPVDQNAIIQVADGETPVRQSRRIAQIKIKEEAERRDMEEAALKKLKAESEKKKKGATPSVVEPEPEVKSESEASVESDIKREAKKKKKKMRGANPWQTDSDEVDADEEEPAEEHYESDHRLVFKSDHEFSPESDIEDDGTSVPVKRARTARKDDTNDMEDEYACQKCGKSDHPEWILLCDKCDKGYHCSCLIPVLFLIPEGDWFCPLCQQQKLIDSLQFQLLTYDKVFQEREIEEQHRQREEVAASINMVKGVLPEEPESEKEQLPSKNRKRRPLNRRRRHRSADSDDDSQSSISRKRESSDDSSDDNEPIYKLRKRRQTAMSYRFNEYDDLINRALNRDVKQYEETTEEVKEEVEDVAGNLGRGKDISTIIGVEIQEPSVNRGKTMFGDEEDGKEEEVRKEPTDEDTENVTKAGKKEKAKDSSSDSEPIRPSLLSRTKKKKSRKLNSLDIDSEDDGSDDDFRTSSLSEDEEEDENFSASESDSSLEMYKKKKGKGRETRRSVRTRTKRFDADFINDTDDDDDVPLKTRAKARKKKVDSDFDDDEFNNETTDEEQEEDLDSEDLCDDNSDSESDQPWNSKKKMSKAKKSTNAAAVSAPKKSPVQKKKIVSPNEVKKPKTGKQMDSGNSEEEEENERDEDDSDDDDLSSKGRRTRGNKLTYLLDDFESSDDGIKPGVKRPDTPPEERAAFIKKQEEIKRMLAEKNMEAAKALAAPKINAIPTPEKHRRPDSLSTVPLQVIQTAKALDVDLKRSGKESENDTDGFDDDLPEDFDPEDMDEEEIAKMMEEEDFAQHQLKLAGEAIRNKKIKDAEQSKKKDNVKIQSAELPSQLSSVPPPNLISDPMSTPAQVLSSSTIQNPMHGPQPQPNVHGSLQTNVIQSLSHGPNRGPPLPHGGPPNVIAHGRPGLTHGPVRHPHGPLVGMAAMGHSGSHNLPPHTIRMGSHLPHGLHQMPQHLSPHGPPHGTHRPVGSSHGPPHLGHHGPPSGPYPGSLHGPIHSSLHGHQQGPVRSMVHGLPPHGSPQGPLSRPPHGSPHGPPQSSHGPPHGASHNSPHGHPHLGPPHMAQHPHPHRMPHGPSHAMQMPQNQQHMQHRPQPVMDYPHDKMVKLTKMGAEPKKRGRKSKAELQAIEQTRVPCPSIGLPGGPPLAGQPTGSGPLHGHPHAPAPSSAHPPSLITSKPPTASSSQDSVISQPSVITTNMEPIIPTTVLSVQNTRLLDPSELGPPGSGDATIKKRGRRKKFTPLRETLRNAGPDSANQLQSIESKTNPILADRLMDNRNSNLSVATPPQLYSPGANTQPSVITRLPRPPSGSPFGPGPSQQRFYAPPHSQSASTSPNSRPTYPPHGPPPLTSRTPPTSSPAPPPNALHSPAGYAPSEHRQPAPHGIYRGPPSNFPSGPTLSGPPPMHRSGEHSRSSPQEYSNVPPYAVQPPYGNYYPPHQPPPQSAIVSVAQSSSVPVIHNSAAVEQEPLTVANGRSNTSTSSVSENEAISRPTPAIVQPSSVIDSRAAPPGSGSFEQYDNAKNTPPHHGRSTPITYQNSPPAAEELPATSSSEFSGLVSYFSSQQDDLET